MSVLHVDRVLASRGPQVCPKGDEFRDGLAKVPEFGLLRDLSLVFLSPEVELGDLVLLQGGGELLVLAVADVDAQSARSPA